MYVDYWKRAYGLYALPKHLFKIMKIVEKCIFAKRLRYTRYAFSIYLYKLHRNFTLRINSFSASNDKKCEILLFL